MPRIAYVNGRYVPHHQASVHIEDRGLQFADSVYEVVAVMNGFFADEEGHIDRLERSLSELKIKMPMPRRALKMILRETLRRNKIKNAGIYIQVTRGTAPRDFKFPKNTLPTLIVTVRATSFDLDKRKADVKKAITLPDIRWQRRDIKTTGLLAQALAKQAALDAGAYDAWMVDGEGFITEASSSNAWIVNKKGELITRPTAHNSILKGVTRNAIQSLCAADKIKIIERPFSIKEAHEATEAFTSSAVALIVPIGHIDGKKIGDGKIGNMTSKIFDIYMTYATDQSQKQRRWNAK